MAECAPCSGGMAPKCVPSFRTHSCVFGSMPHVVPHICALHARVVLALLVDSFVLNVRVMPYTLDEPSASEKELLMQARPVGVPSVYYLSRGRVGKAVSQGALLLLLAPALAVSALGSAGDVAAPMEWSRGDHLCVL